MGTSDDNIKQLQLKESDWAYEWFDNDLFAAEQPQHTVSLPAFEIAQDPVTNAEYYTLFGIQGIEFHAPGPVILSLMEPKNILW